MKRRLLLPGCGLLAVIGVLALATPGNGTQSYSNEFKAMYVHADKTDNVSKSLAAAVKKAGCAVCHSPTGAKKGHYNAYGKQLAKLLKKGDDKDTEEDPRRLEEGLQHAERPQRQQIADVRLADSPGQAARRRLGQPRPTRSP